MVANFNGVFLSVTIIITIFLGHHFVRAINYHFGTKPALFVAITGLLLLVVSFFIKSDIISAVTGIIAITTIIDGYEIVRQEKRIINGHAKENPERPVNPGH